MAVSGKPLQKAPDKMKKMFAEWITRLLTRFNSAFSTMRLAVDLREIPKTAFHAIPPASTRI
jgi:hypothetical protein